MNVYLPPNQEPLAVTVLMHGLNNPPALMIPLARKLNQWGIAVVNGVLTGHDGDMSIVRRIDAERWGNDVLQAAEKAHELAKGDLPVYFTGFSLGGLSGMYASKIQPGVFKKALLFAPALALKRAAYFSRPLLPVLSPFSVFSIAPKKYSASRWIPVQAYRNLFAMHDALHESKFENLGEMPVKILMRHNDELIHYKGIKKIIQQYGMEQWELVPLPQRTDSIQHMIVDLSVVGEKNRAIIDQTIQDFFGGKKRE